MTTGAASRSLRLALIVLTLVALVGLFLGRTAASQLTLKSITVVVQVAECGTKAPIAGAKVTIVDVTQDGKVLAQGVTDADGRFSAVILILALDVADAVDKIDVRVEKEGYTVGTSLKLVLEGPTGEFISVSVCLNPASGQGGSPSQPQPQPSQPQPPEVECALTLTPGQPLQPFLDQAEPGMTICLQPGSYLLPKSLRLEKELVLVGLGSEPTQTVLRGGFLEPVIVVRAEGSVLFWNLTIREGSGAGPEERGGGVHIEDSSDVTLRRVVLTNNVRFGLLAKRSRVRIEESRVLNTQPATPGRDGHGLRLRGSQVHVVKTVIQANGASGLAARDFEGEPSRVVIEESTIMQNVFNGLSVYDSSKLEVRRSRIAGNVPYRGQFGDGIFAGAEAELVLEENVIEGHRPRGQFARTGVILTEDVTAVLRRNRIRNNDWGVMVGDTNIPLEFIEAEFIENVFSMNDQCGLWIDEDETITISGSGNRFEERPGRGICGAIEKIPEGFKASGGEK